MKSFCVVVLMIGAIFATGIAHATCEDDSVDSVSDDGEILKTLSGHVFEVMAGDSIDSALWLTTEDLLICPQPPIQFQGKSVVIYKIINTDSNNEKVDATKLR